MIRRSFLHGQRPERSSPTPHPDDGDSIARGAALADGLSHPTDWVALARRCPPFARILIATTVNGRGETVCRKLSDWTARFARRPRWSRILAEFSDRVESHPADAQGVALASLAREVADRTGWAPFESAYWFALCGFPDELAATPVPLQPAMPSLEEGVVRCRFVARCLLNRGSTPVGASAGESLRHERLALLEERHPDIDWTGILAALPDAIEQPATEWTDELRARLYRQAEAAQLRADVDFRDALLAVAHADEPTELADAVIGVFTTGFFEEGAVWLSIDEGDHGVAAGRTETGPDGTITRTDFETSRLPTRFRWSRDLLDRDGDPIGRVYATEAPPDDQQTARFDAALHTIERLAADVRERSVLRRRVDRQSARLRETEEDGARALRSRLRSAIGEFGAGAGHEINNPLGTILGKVEWLCRDEIDPRRREAFGKIAEQVDRIRRMIRDLHFIGAPSIVPKEAASLETIVAQGVAEATASASATVGQLTVEPVDPHARVIGVEADLVRMVGELVRNAMEAAGPEGRVRVRVVDGGVIEIVDSGPGFTPHARRHAFDPFFSGRSAGRGLGMGLTVADRIAEDHRGRITIGHQRPTTVTALLPLAPETPETIHLPTGTSDPL